MRGGRQANIRIANKKAQRRYRVLQAYGKRHFLCLDLTTRIIKAISLFTIIYNMLLLEHKPLVTRLNLNKIYTSLIFRNTIMGTL